jgi:FkbM family methyltransferase
LRAITRFVTRGIIVNLLLEASRWFNYRFPWHQLKPSLAKRMRARLEAFHGLTVYDGIQGNLRMRLDLAHHLERDIYLNASNLEMLSVFRRILRAGDVAVDGGANIGFLSLVTWQCVGPRGKVYAFEPQPSTVELLKGNLELNHVENIVIIAKALWNEPGTATLYEFAEADHDLPSLARRSDKGVGREFTVETVRMDDVVREPVRLYKLDIEGAEWHAMRGSQRILFNEPAPHVIIELNPRTCESFGHSPLQVFDWLMDHAPNRCVRLIRRRRCVRINRQNLAELFQRQQNKSHNVWFEPV